jgi:hypothetical protein
MLPDEGAGDSLTGSPSGPSRSEQARQQDFFALCCWRDADARTFPSAGGAHRSCLAGLRLVRQQRDHQYRFVCDPGACEGSVVPEGPRDDVERRRHLQGGSRIRRGSDRANRRDYRLRRRYRHQAPTPEASRQTGFGYRGTASGEMSDARKQDTIQTARPCNRPQQSTLRVGFRSAGEALRFWACESSMPATHFLAVLDRILPSCGPTVQSSPQAGMPVTQR